MVAHSAWCRNSGQETEDLSWPIGPGSTNLRFITRHPLLIVFIIGVLALSYGVYYKIQSAPAVSMGGGPGGPGGPGGLTDTVVTTAVVGYDTLIDEVESVGTALANESVNITPKVSDTITRVHFTDGQFVREGDILVELTNAAEAARLAEAQTALDDAQRQYERMQQLANDNLVSRSDLDDASSRLETASARMEGVMANMQDRLIRAPFDGILGFRNVSEGSLVTPNTVITTLDDISVIKLDFNVAESYLAQLGTGLQIEGSTIAYPGRVFEGKVQVLGSRVDPVTRSVQVRAEIDNVDGELRPGMLLTVGMMLNEREVMVIPEQALIPSAGSQYVFVVDEENIARRVEVSLGSRRPGIVEITEGLVPGQRIITEGVAQVRPNQPVRILNSSSVRSRPAANASGDVAPADNSRARS